ncbi:MAG: anti-sigma factor, partial [Flavobacteriales bacterium]
MNHLDIEKIITKYINQEANLSELKNLNLWLQNDKNIILFNNFIKVEYLTAVQLGAYNVKKAKASVKAKYEMKKKEKRNSFLKKISIAASVIILFGFSFSQFKENNTIKNNILTTKIIEIESNKAILTLNNGKNVPLDTDKKYSSNKANGNDKELLYLPKRGTNNSTKKLAYNYLTIPKGGEFFVLLSD